MSDEGRDGGLTGDLMRAYKAYQEAAALHREVTERSRREIVAARATEIETFRTWREQRAEFYRRAFKSKIITRAVVDVLAPTHTARCLDNCPDRDNKCARCFMLRALDDPYVISNDDVLRVAYTTERA